MYLIQVTNYISNLLIQFYFRNLPFVRKSSFTSMRQIEIVIVTHWLEIKFRKQLKLSVCLQLTPHNINQKKNLLLAGTTNDAFFAFSCTVVLHVLFWEISPEQNCKVSFWARPIKMVSRLHLLPFSLKMPFFTLVFGCATSKNAWDH